LKISNVEILHLPMSGKAGISRWNPVYVRINTTDGLSGIGEVGMAYGIGAEAAVGMLKNFAEAYLIGSDPLANEPLWERMYRRSFWAEGGGPVVTGALSAIDIALWDIKGKALGLPIWRLLGATQARPLRTYASQIQFNWGPDPREGLVEPTQYRDAAAKARAEGYDCVKVDPVMIDRSGKWNDFLRGGIDRRTLAFYRKRMEAVREGVGDDVDIILELHSLLSVTGAKQIIEALEDIGLFIIEEPVHYANPQAHLSLSRTFPRHRFAAGERLYTRWGVEPYVRTNALDVLQPDFGLVGGVTEGKKVCDLAHLYDITVQGHVCGTPIATAVALHVETAIPNFEIHEHHVYALKSVNRDLCDIDLQPRNGVITAPDGPGLGINLTDFALAQARIIPVS
jgi:galactonate dehydratase